MANDCLVTTLKGSVNNDDLKKLGVLSLKVRVSDTEQVTATNMSMKLVAVSGKTFVVRIKDGDSGLIWDSSTNWGNDSLGRTSFEVGDTQKILYFKKGNYIVEFYQKYDISQLRCDNARYFEVSDAEWLSGLGVLWFASAWYTEFMKSLFNSPNIATIKLLSASMEKGHIRDYAYCYTIINFSVQGARNFIGNIEDFAGDMYNTYGRHSGSIEANFKGSAIKCKNSVMTSAATINFSASGVTIVVDNETYATYDGTDWKDDNGDVYVPEDY